MNGYWQLWHHRISSFKNNIAFVYRVNLPLYCDNTYEGNNLTKIEFLPFWIEEKKSMWELV